MGRLGYSWCRPPSLERTYSHVNSSRFFRGSAGRRTAGPLRPVTADPGGTTGPPMIRHGVSFQP